jgi:site-specific recombinase XerD
LAEGYFRGKRIDIPLDVLEQLTVQQIEDFLSFLQFKLDNKDLTINRKISALKSLFHYLQNVAETRDLKPYILRNVVAKIELNQVKDDQ